MYTNFYGLKRTPFELSPDPAFYFATPQHDEAMANLWCGIEQRKGFVVITGDVGSGKTLLVRYLLMAMSRSGVQFSYVFNPRLSSADFLQYLMADFDLPSFGKSKAELLVTLNRWLIEKHKHGLTAALVVDEAHLLDLDCLEEVRLLTNLETVEHKLLQVILVGQTELDEKLESQQLRQLRQRIAFRAKLSPLTEPETAAYIHKRLEVAGSKPGARMFPNHVCCLIHRYSGGVPRLINSICENALISGFAEQVDSITPELIHEVARDFGLTLASGSNPTIEKAAHEIVKQFSPSNERTSLIPTQKVI